MSRTYNVIDSDGHVLEPPNFWSEYIDPEYRDRAPELFVDTDGKERLRIEGKVFGQPLGGMAPSVHPWAPYGTGPVMGTGVKYGQAQGMIPQGHQVHVSLACAGLHEQDQTTPPGQPQKRRQKPHGTLAAPA